MACSRREDKMLLTPAGYYTAVACGARLCN